MFLLNLRRIYHVALFCLMREHSMKAAAAKAAQGQPPKPVSASEAAPKSRKSLLLEAVMRVLKLVGSKP